VRRTAVIGVALALAAPSVALTQRAQRPLSQRPGPPPAGRLTDSGAQGGGRARLEMEVRRNFARLVRQRVGLTDAQMTRLIPITQKYEQQRRQIQMQERDARVSLQTAMRNEQAADPKLLEQQMQTILDVHKRRAALLEAEQRELAEFMTPVQRVKFMAVQEQIRRNLEQMRQRRVP
jgi:periplasmic protein CpxP/Spy